jgi:hypothetical protein
MDPQGIYYFWYGGTGREFSDLYVICTAYNWKFRAVLQCLMETKKKSLIAGTLQSG